MPRPATDLEKESTSERLAIFLKQHLNDAVENTALVGEAIAADAFALFLDTGGNFPLLQVFQGQSKGQTRRELLTIQIEYYMPPGIGSSFMTSGQIDVVTEELENAFHQLPNNPSVMGNCIFNSMVFTPMWLKFGESWYRMLKCEIEVSNVFS